MTTSLRTSAAGTVTGNITQIATTTPATLVNGTTLFTSVGDIQIVSLMSECLTANNTVASTLQYAVTPDATGVATTISGATTTLASAGVGTIVTLYGSSLTASPQILTNGVGFSTYLWQTFLFPTGQLKLVIGVGSSTGTWKHYLSYMALEPGAYVVPAF